MVGSTAWMDRSACLDIEPDVFFPGSGESDAEPKSICAACSVRMQCLEYAITNMQEHGIWGGLNANERRRIRLARQRQQRAS